MLILKNKGLIRIFKINEEMILIKIKKEKNSFPDLHLSTQILSSISKYI